MQLCAIIYWIAIIKTFPQECSVYGTLIFVGMFLSGAQMLKIWHFPTAPFLCRNSFHFPLPSVTQNRVFPYSRRVSVQEDQRIWRTVLTDSNAYSCSSYSSITAPSFQTKASLAFSFAGMGPQITPSASAMYLSRLSTR